MVNFKNWFRGTYSEDRDIWIQAQIDAGSGESRGNLEVRYVQEVYSVRLNRPIPANEVIQVDVTGNSFRYNGHQYTMRERGTFCRCMCKASEKCLSAILISSLFEQGPNLAFLTNTIHSHYVASDFHYDPVDGQSIILKELVSAFAVIEQIKGGATQDLVRCFEEQFCDKCDDPIWLEQQSVEVQSAVYLFKDYQQCFRLALQKFSDDPEQVNSVYSYFSTNLSDDSYWSDIIMLLTYIGQRTSIAKRRANDEKSNGRWRMHVKKCGGWQFKGLALLEGVSKRCSDYFEESLIRLFGQSLTGVSQISNGKPPMRFQPDSLGSVESDLKAASFLLLYSSYCDKDYYNVDMRPSKMIYVGNYIVDEEKWTEWKAMLNVDEVVAENLSLRAQIIEKDQELADKDQVIVDQAQLIEELNRMLDDLNLLPHKRAKIE